MLVGSLTYFDLIFVLTGGGPGRRDPDPAAGHVPDRLPQLQHGRGQCPSAVILVAVGLTLVLGLQRLTGSEKMESQEEGA